MSYQDAHSRRSARAFLCTQPKAKDEPTLAHEPVITGWKPHIMPRSDAEHMRISAFTPIAYETIDAIENELRALGLTAQDPHVLNKDMVPGGDYLIAADAPTYDGKHVQGLSITMSRDTFDNVLAPQLDRWRTAARGASI